MFNKDLQGCLTEEEKANGAVASDINPHAYNKLATGGIELVWFCPDCKKHQEIRTPCPECGKPTIEEINNFKPPLKIMCLTTKGIDGRTING